MENLQRQIDEILARVNEIDNKIEGKQDKAELGLISKKNKKIMIELLLDEKLFNDNDLERLQKIAEDLQLLMLDIDEIELIKELFFNNYSLRKYAKKLDISHNTLYSKLKTILFKLKKSLLKIGGL